MRAFNDAISYGNSAYIRGGPIRAEDVYHAGDQIVCQRGLLGSDGICLFTQGNVPAEGVTGQQIIMRLSELIEHGCRKCGSVPLSGDNDPDKMGTLTGNYVRKASCNGVCCWRTLRQCNSQLRLDAESSTFEVELAQR